MPQKKKSLERFGENLRALRLQSGMSQEDLALESGLDRSYVGGVERGERNISLLNIVKLAGSLRTTPAELMKGIGNDDD
jgi:transcriptional regulator with XRE-family HTH domain